MTHYICCQRNIQINNIHCHLFLLEEDNGCVRWPHMDHLAISNGDAQLQQECHYEGDMYLFYEYISPLKENNTYIWATLHEIVNLKKVDALDVSEKTIQFVLHHLDIFVCRKEENVMVGYINIIPEMLDYYKYIGIPFKEGESYIEITTIYNIHSLKCYLLLGKHICIEKEANVYKYLPFYDSVLQNEYIYLPSERNVFLLCS